MDVLPAHPRSVCAGIGRAIVIVEQALQRFGAPVYVYHEIVRDRVVLDALRAKGARFIASLDEAPHGAVLVFNAHGVTQRLMRKAHDKGLEILDATCPLVSKVHREVIRHREQGREVLLVGQAGHPEIIGTLGQVESGVHLVQTVADVGTVVVRDPKQVAWATQTTLSVDVALEVVAAIRARFPNAVGPKPDDIGDATQNGS